MRQGYMIRDMERKCVTLMNSRKFMEKLIKFFMKLFLNLLKEPQLTRLKIEPGSHKENPEELVNDDDKNDDEKNDDHKDDDNDDDDDHTNHAMIITRWRGSSNIRNEKILGAFRKRDHDEHPDDDALLKGERIMKRQKMSRRSKSVYVDDITLGSTKPRLSQPRSTSRRLKGSFVTSREVSILVSDRPIDDNQGDIRRLRIGIMFLDPARTEGSTWDTPFDRVEVLSQNQRDLPKDTPIDGLEVLRRDANPIHTLVDYSKPSHEGYRNTIELSVQNNVPLALGTTFEARVRDYMIAHIERMERFKNAIFKQREKINDRMAEMFRLLNELTTSRVPKKVLIKEEAKSLVTKNINSISLTRGEEERNNDNDIVTGDDIKKLPKQKWRCQLVFEWEEKIKLHQETEIEFDRWRKKNFKNERPASVKIKDGMDDEGEVTLYLMRRNLEILRKFHWMILGGRFNQLSNVSSPLLSKPEEY
nr:hypothetical protein [Tanacetum cinerariifolium]